MSKHVTMAGWSDVPHLSPEVKKTLYAAIPPYQRDARSKGVPQLGSGAIYPVPESEVTVADFKIPNHWPRGYGFDVGWNKTAAIFGALDRETDTLYLYSEHYKGQAEPVIHATGIKARGEWIPGAIDPAARGRGQRDGEQLLQDYIDLGLDLTLANNAVESGLFKVWQRLSTGRLRVFKSLENWLGEFRIYRRDEKGHIVKANDHLMDACVTADTLVNTDKGKVRIVDLIGKKGKVISRDGSKLGFTGARLTIKNSPVVKVVFADGSKVTCTPDHKFLTENGWVEAKDMQGLNCYNGVTQSIKVKSWLLMLSQIPSKSSRVLGITYVANTFSVMALGFIGKCGNQITVKYQKGLTFTTKIMIEVIMNPKILIYSPEQSIYLTTKKDAAENCQTQRWKQLQNGISQKKEKSGIKSIMKPCRENSMSKKNLFVRLAINPIVKSLQEKIDFAVITVKLKRVSYLVLTMKNAFAWFVSAVLWRIVTLRNKRAQKDVLLPCLSVVKAGRSNVYCLTVPVASAFCIESGLVVHNTRYLVQECERIDFMITKPTRRQHVIATTDYEV